MRSNMQGKEYRELPEEMYRMLFEKACDAIFVADLEGNFIAVNQAACDHVGYAREALLRMRPEQINGRESSEKVAERLAWIRKDGECTFEAVHAHRDGKHIPVEMHMRVIEHGGQQVILNICRNIASRKQSEIEYRKIIQATGDGYWMVNAQDARIIDVNDTFCNMVGYSREALLSMCVSDLEAVESPEETAAHIRKVIATGHDLFETRHRHKDGHLVEFEVSVSYADIRGGVIFVFVRDISERKRHEAELELSALVFNASTASIVVADAKGLIVCVNPAFTQATGYEPHEVIGRNPRLLSSGRQSKEFYQNMWQTLEKTGHWEGEWWNKRKDGELYAEQVSLNTVRNKDGSVHRYVKISSDVTEKKRLDDLIWRQANYDSVTNLPNRRLFLDRLAQGIKKCYRAKESLALFFIDLDRFKEVNDEFGHAVGDCLLVEVSRRINACVRSSDTVARLGGDEFTVVLADLARTSRIDAVARNIADVLAQPFRFDGIETSISGSMVIAIYPADASDIDELIKKADEAMYAAKNSGRNRFSYAKQITSKGTKR
ncbi:MAG: PAS domain S-box protein [Sulfuricellaceae bacterium]|nr:PAS domain S-box protein [Sulfuricellaceae bacterium]